MSELHRFLFDGLPVRGVLVRLTGAWTEILRRHASGKAAGAYPLPVQNMLGEMLAAATLMQSNIKFNGSLTLQMLGDGPVKLAVVEVQPDFGLRATATVIGAVAADASLSSLVNVNNQGQCAITLDPKDRLPGQQAYQGVVSLSGPACEKLGSLSQVLEHYMRQSEQLDTTLVLAADDQVAAGLLIQRVPQADEVAGSENYQRIALLAASLKREELLTLEVETILRRLFWQEELLRFAPLVGDTPPHFACTCSRERVHKMILGLGSEEAHRLLAERGEIEVGCNFCGVPYRFGALEVAQIFSAATQ